MKNHTETASPEAQNPDVRMTPAETEAKILCLYHAAEAAAKKYEEACAGLPPLFTHLKQITKLLCLLARDARDAGRADIEELANHAFCGLYDIEREEALLQNWRDALSASNRAAAVLKCRVYGDAFAGAFLDRIRCAARDAAAAAHNDGKAVVS